MEFQSFDRYAKGYCLALLLKASMDSKESSLFQQEQRVLECLATLSYRTGDLGGYLREIVHGVSRLICSDWSIVTICEGDTGSVVASSLEMGEGDRGFSVHGTLVDEITQSGRSLVIEDAQKVVRQPKPPEDYLCYLGVPLRTSSGAVIGTICSFLRQPRQFEPSEVMTVELFADRAATAIDNYRLYQQQQQFNERLAQEVTSCTYDLRISQAALIERERLAAIGEFTAMIVHEVRNPLTTIEMGLNHAKRGMLSAPDQERLALSLGESKRLKKLLNEILLYAKPQILNLERVNITPFLSKLLVQLQEMPAATERHIEFVHTAPDIEVLADIDKLQQVFTNLVQNAFEAIAPHETVRCEIMREANSEWIRVDIYNGGDPIPPEILPRLTTPFCSTKLSGTGLGLAIVKRIITEHGGEFSITSSPSGTTVSVRLRIAPP
jgi:signal transduction histidine kinase